MKFSQLINAIGHVHETSRQNAAQGANITFTPRNRIVGKPLLQFVPSIWQTVSAKSSKGATDTLIMPVEKLISNLTFSHFVELLKVDEPNSPTLSSAI
jgi:hypothetical protein